VSDSGAHRTWPAMDFHRPCGPDERKYLTNCYGRARCASDSPLVVVQCTISVPFSFSSKFRIFLCWRCRVVVLHLFFSTRREHRHRVLDGWERCHSAIPPAFRRSARNGTKREKRGATRPTRISIFVIFESHLLHAFSASGVNVFRKSNANVPTRLLPRPSSTAISAKAVAICRKLSLW
jgi:hypothetical protein